MTCTLEKHSNVLDEKAKKTIRKALKVLGKKNLAFIMHNGSFPAAQNQNTGFGSINSDGGKEFIEYASGLFDAIQLGPAGKTKSCDSSPYTGTIFSDNPLFINLKELTTKDWGKILSENILMLIRDTARLCRKHGIILRLILLKNLKKNLNILNVKTVSGWIKTAFMKLCQLNMEMITGLYGTRKPIKIFLIRNQLNKKCSLQKELKRLKINIPMKLSFTNLLNLL